MRRREFIAPLCGAAVLPIAAWAQQLPVVAFIDPGDAVGHSNIIIAFQRGLNAAGFIDGQNVTVESHWLEGKFDSIRALVADLVARRVSVIASTTSGALAAKAATSTIPIVFATGGDPVKLGLVSSLNRPGGNMTGVTFLAPLMGAKRLGLLHEMAPQANLIAVLLNPNTPVDTQSGEIDEAAGALGLKLKVENASTERDLDPAFAAFARARAAALLVGSDPFFHTKREIVIAQAARHMLPAIYEWRDFAEDGGLMSYGTSLTDAYRQAGSYTGQILKGVKPADLPVLQATKFEFVINLRTAKTLGVQVPPSLSARADEVIE